MRWMIAAVLALTLGSVARAADPLEPMHYDGFNGYCAEDDYHPDHKFIEVFGHYDIDRTDDGGYVLSMTFDSFPYMGMLEREHLTGGDTEHFRGVLIWTPAVNDIWGDLKEAGISFPLKTHTVRRIYIHPHKTWIFTELKIQFRTARAKCWMEAPIFVGEGG